MGGAGAGGQGAVIVARGARATEALVLAEVGALADAARRDPALLARPVVVVVPSRSLRLHLCTRLVEARGAVAGIEVVTLHGLAHRVLAAAGEAAPRGEALVPVLVRRAARSEPALASYLEPLADGYAGIGGTVRDLLDAGLEAAHAEALDERLAELDRGGSDAGVARARAIVRVAAYVHAEMERLGLGRASTLLRRAADLVLGDAESVLAVRAVLVHGFAEATGVAADLLEALVRRRGARVFVDVPPDPADPATADLGAEYARRLRERLAGYAPELDGGAAREAPRLTLRRAPGAFAEVRAVAADVRELLDGGEIPETIGIVARDLSRVQHALHQHLGRLCVPYSCSGAPGLRGPASRRVEALVELLLAGPEATLDAWLDVTRGLAGHRVSDLRLGLRVLGTATVGDVAALRVVERLGGLAALPLPVRRGIAVSAPEGDVEDGAAEPEGEAAERGARATRRSLHAERLERAVADARAWCRAWGSLPARGAMPEFAAALRRLLDEIPSRRARRDGDDAPDDRGGAQERLRELADALPPGLRLEREEALELVREALADEGRVTPGGAGAGVQVLGVVEARARTFAHLFVVGLNRDAFPRVVREDWLLPDRLRAALRPLLPDIPLKRTGHDEERYLFAQLLAAAPRVTVSWSECDDDGKPTPASPLVERLRAGDPDRAPLLRDLYAPGGVGDRIPRPPHEHAVLAGLHGGRDDLAAVLPIALAAGAGGGGGEDEAGTALSPLLGAPAAAVAAARTAVLAELDPDRRTPEGRRRAALPGPYLGFVGATPWRDDGTGGAAADGRRDARGGRLWVTELEGLARCPWQTFLRRLLRLEPVPDGGVELPALAGAVVGSVVHVALERIARAGDGDAPAALRDVALGAARQVAWPDGRSLDAILAGAAESVLREEGIALPLLVRAAAERARPLLDAAHAADFAGAAAVAVAAVEVEGEAAVADGRGRSRPVAFRADRVDAVAGAAWLTDYKTGARTFTTARKPEQQRTRLLDAIAGGLYLQAAAYAAAAGPGGAGRYLFLKPDLADEARAIVAPSDTAVLAAFGRAVADLLALRDAGAFFPRLVTADGRREGPECARCDLREACLAGDSGARRRMLAWVAADAAAPATEEIAAAAAVWNLGRDEGGEGGA